MKLPLDNFQILGVSPGSSTKNILLMLERKLDKCNYSGFSEATLKRRSQLLQEYSQPLLDTEKRKEIEMKYKIAQTINEDKRYLETPIGCEIAGLLLLLECGDYDECLGLANELTLERRRARDSDGDKLTDLSRLIGYATLEYGKVLKSKRYYENCARILEKGLGSIQDNSDLTEIEMAIREELEKIIPFRILDLLSREMDEPIREVGIKLLHHFVIQRGGLDRESDLYMKDAEFKSFFRQIRYFLTVQEQIDLYKEWCQAGSQSACFLLGISLVASGFARRKPERLVQALDVMNNLDANELRDMIAYISLLLGRVNPAEDISSSSFDDGQDPVSESFGGTLGKLCANCRVWLGRDVLEGYRDLEADPDLEAYFSDRDVTTFIEMRDRQLIVERPSTKMPFAPLEFSQRFLQRSTNHKQSNWLDQSYTRKHEEMNYFRVNSKKGLSKIVETNWKGFAVVFLGGLLFWVVVAKQLSYTNSRQKAVTDSVSHKLATKLKIGNITKAGIKRDERDEGEKRSIEGNPSKERIKDILSKWLDIKSRTLSGIPIAYDAKDLASIQAIKRVESERKEDKQKGEKQKINVQVSDLEVLTRDKDRVEVLATLLYSDERLNRENEVIEKTPKHVFKKTYILVNRGSKWLLQ